MSNKDYSDYSDKELLEIINKPEESLFDKAARYADKFNKGVEATHLPEFAGGILQGVGDIGASLGNLIARPLGHPIPHPELNKYIGTSWPSRLAFGAGNLAAQIPAYTSGAGLIGKAGLGAGAGLSGKVAQGALAGGLLGENEEGGRIGGTVEGGAMPIAGAAIKKVIAMRPKNIAANVAKAMEETGEHYKKEFGNIFSNAKERGYAGNYEPMKYNETLLKRAGDKDFLYALEKYNQKPSLEAAHNAQSDLGKFIADIGKPNNTLDRHAIKEAKKVAAELRKHIIQQLNRSGNPDLAMNYSFARQGYKEDYVPYLKNKQLQNYLSNKLTAKDFVKNAAKNEEFKAQIGQERHPEIYQRELLKKILTSKAGQYAIGTGLGGAGLYGLSKYFK
jgi:hypothetical protein